MGQSDIYFINVLRAILPSKRIHSIGDPRVI